MLELQKKKVPLPTTYLAVTNDSARMILERIKYPVILKIPSGTHGKGVMLADSLQSARSILDTLEVFKQPYLIQEYVETDCPPHAHKRLLNTQRSRNYLYT